ncbi:MAG: HAD-IA family hydrolase [Thiolinea sp.]
MNNLKYIVFDLFGVVISDGHLVTHGLLPLLPEGITKAAVKPHYDAYTGGRISEQAFWQNIGQSVDSDIRNQFLNVFGTDEELSQVTQALQERYALGILSNLGAEWGEILENRFHFSRTFKPRIISGEVRCQKPEPQIYEKLIEAAGVDGSQIAFIDDRRENLAVAKSFGMTTIHYLREPDNHPFDPDYTIRRLGEVLLFL